MSPSFRAVRDDVHGMESEEFTAHQSLLTRKTGSGWGQGGGGEGGS